MLRIQRAAGAPLSLGDVTVIPEAWTVRWVSGRAAFAWGAPSSVLVTQGGRQRRIPILDVTRLMQILLLGTAVAVPLVRRWIGREEVRK